MGTTGTATVMFTDAVDSTALRTRLGDDAAEAMRRTHDTLLRLAVAAHGGTLIKGLGDGAMATFASASEAVAAAVETMQAIDVHNRRSVDARLDVRVGLSAGDVLWESDDCFGRPVIEAARLCAEAATGQVLVSDVVRLLARSGDGHAFRACGAKELKGLAEPIDTHELVWVPLPALPAVIGQPPLPELLTRGGQLGFAGRDEQLAAALEAWKTALGGERQALLLAGEPGIGKTRLASEVSLLAHQQGATVLYGRCEEDLGAPYQPFAEALDQLLGSVPVGNLLEQLGRHPEELGRLVPALPVMLPDLPPPLRSDAETERYRLFEAIAEWLTAAAAQRGLVLVLDDLHWAARPTLVLLQHLLHATAGSRLLVLATYRDTDLSRVHPLSALLADLRRAPGVTRLALTGLELEGVVTIMTEAAGHELDETGRSLADAVHAETEGNPFFVGEVLRHLRETRAIFLEDGRWVSHRTVAQLGIPEGVRDVVGRRLNHLSPEANAALSVAAVIGRDFTLGLLSRASGLTEDVVVSGLDEATHARLVEETGVGSYHFSHALVRSTLYEELSATRRARVHARVATELALSDPGDVVTLAHHFSAASVAGDLQQAAAYSSAAGDLALAQLAHDQAVVYYARALELLDEASEVDPATRTETLIRLGEAQRRSGEPEFRDTLLAAAHAARDHGDAQRLVRATLANGRGLWSMAGQLDHERMAMLHAALELIGPDDGPDRARLLARLGSELMFSDDRPARERSSAEAVAVARRVGDPLALADVLAEAVPANYSPWTIHIAESSIRELLDLAPTLDDPYRLALAHLWSYIVSVFTATDPAPGIASLTAATEIAQELGQPTVRWLTMFWQSVRAQTEGRLQRGSSRRSTARRAEVIEQEVDGNPGIPAWRVVLAESLVEVGRHEEAQAIVRRFVDVETGEVRLPEDLMWIYGVASLAGVAGCTGDLAVVELLYDRLLPFRHLTVYGGVAFNGSAEHHLGVAAGALGWLDKGVDHLERAITMHDALGTRYHLGMSHAELARLLRLRTGEGDAARAVSSEALALALAEETGGGAIRQRLPS